MSYTTPSCVRASDTAARLRLHSALNRATSFQPKRGFDALSWATGPRLGSTARRVSPEVPADGIFHAVLMDL